MSTREFLPESRVPSGDGRSSARPAAGPEQPRLEQTSVALFGLLRRYALLIILSGLAVAALAYFVSNRSPKVYSATASLLFRQSALVEQLTGLSGSEQFTNPEQESATNVALVSTQAVAKETARRLGDGYSARDVSEAVVVIARPNTRVIDVKGGTGDASESARIANTFAVAFVAGRVREQQRVIRETLARLESGLEALPTTVRQGVTGQDLQERIGTLRILEAVQSPNVELIQSAEPPRFPIAPRPKRDAILGGLFGLLLGFGLAVLRERTDVTIRDVAALEAASHAPLLGVVPRHRSLDEPVPPLELPPDLLETFRLVQASLRYAGDPNLLQCLVITSTAPQEGKTMCAWHLAVAAASTGSSTLLIEADLRRRSLAKRFDVVPSPGLSTVLLGQVTLEEAVQDVPVARRSGEDDRSTLDLHVLTAGATVGNPADLLDSAEMYALLRDAQTRYDTVIVDTPPIAYVADAIPLMSIAHGVLLVSRLGATNRREFARLQSRLEQLGLPVVGVVANYGQDLSRYYGEGVH